MSLVKETAKVFSFLTNLPLAFNNKSTAQVGGQAVIEGVMMKAPEGWSVAVRDPAQRIVIKKEALKKIRPIWKLPLLRGPVVLCQTLKLGFEALEFSAQVAQSQEEKTLSKSTMIITFMIAFLIATGLFLFLPVYITKTLGHIFKDIAEGQLLFNLVDGMIRIMIFLLYVFVVGFWKDMKRIFEYHGAEHKVIHAYENGKSLEVKEASNMSPLHPRCGTSFLMIVMIISILVFSMIPKDFSLLEKFISRVILIPVIAGLSYEVLRASARFSSTPFMKLFVLPGLALQRLTTREPDDAQLEVAVIALKEALSFTENQAK